MENKIWNSLSDEARKEVVEYYNSQEKIIKGNLTENSMIAKGAVIALNEMFGKENIKPELKIRTWDDVIDRHEQIIIHIAPETCEHFEGKVIRKAIATFKIAKLIELAYGGMITDDEWMDCNIGKYTIEADNDNLVCGEKCSIRHLIAFHTTKQRNEFLKYNRQLCKDYYMI